MGGGFPIFGVLETSNTVVRFCKTGLAVAGQTELGVAMVGLGKDFQALRGQRFHHIP